MKVGAEEETNLYLRKGDESESEGGEWDDSKLIRAYDKAIAKAKQQILKKLQAEMDLTNEEVKEVLGESTSNSAKKKKKKGKKKKNKVSDGKIDEWEVGDACRAIYSEDGEEYEAEILKIINGKRCLVKFFGYGNEEEVLLKDLAPSLGKNVVQLQIDTAREENEGKSEEDESDETASTLPNGEVPDPRMFYQRPPMFHTNHVLPPPPPPPPMFGSAPFQKFWNTANGPTHPSLSADEARNAMMFSWYMCGYYTGYYQRDIKN